MPIICTSALRRERLAAPIRRQAPVIWPIRRGGHIQMLAIDAERIPRGWQSISARVPQRLATCAETRCPMYLKGWTEVALGDGNIIPTAGRMSRDEAAAKFGIYGDQPPLIVEHPPGTPCRRIHKTATGEPPLYRVNGAIMEEAAFLDAIGEGVYGQQRRTQEGSY